MYRLYIFKMYLIVNHLPGVASNVHGEGHHHHDHNHVDHGDHHHHDHGGSGDCELDDSLAELIKSFGLAVLGKDQESADDVQPTEDHDHINIKVYLALSNHFSIATYLCRLWLKNCFILQQPRRQPLQLQQEQPGQNVCLSNLMILAGINHQ